MNRGLRVRAGRGRNGDQADTQVGLYPRIFGQFAADLKLGSRAIRPRMSRQLHVQGTVFPASLFVREPRSNSGPKS